MWGADSKPRKLEKSWRPRRFTSVEGRVCTVAKRDGDAPAGVLVRLTHERSASEPRRPGKSSIGMVADGGGARGRTEALRRAEVGSRIDPYCALKQRIVPGGLESLWRSDEEHVISKSGE